MTDDAQTGDRARGTPAISATFPSAAWLADLLARGSSAAFADARAALDARVGRYHDVLPPLPDRQAGYYHEFFCPDHAVQLVFNPLDGHHHACPIDGRIFSGEPFDSAWGWSVNDALSDAALRSALRRSLGHAPDRADADAGLVRHVLLGYAARYRTMPGAPQPYPGEYAGRVCWSALDESVWIIRLAWAAALARDAFTEQDRGVLADGLFRPALEQLWRVRYRQIQNVGNWDRGAILTLGLLLGDEATVGRALDEEYGVRDQLARGVTADGLWWELSLSYHFYVLGAVSWTMRAMRAAGRPFDRTDVVQRMFQAPLDLAFPDGSLPATNDCWYHIGLTGEVGHGIPDADGFYEMAYGWFGEPTFAWVIGENRRRNGPRVTMEALLDGAPEIPAVKRGATPSRHLSDSGLAMLRAAPGPTEIAVLLKASASDGDSHGHPDQLGVAVFGAGARVTIDPGTPGYGIALNDTWYRQTASHSSVLIDGRSQPPGSARITRWDADTDASAGSVVVEAEIEWPGPDRWPDVTARAIVVSWPDRAPHPGYAGVRIRRHVDVQPNEIVDIVTVEAPDERAIDLVQHLPPGAGSDVSSVPSAGEVALGSGYEHLSDVRRLPPGWRLTADLPGGRLAVTPATPDAAGRPAEVAWLASGPGNPAADRHAVLVRRQTAASARFETRFRFGRAAEA